jgi:omega-6 fatty acid desaturase (delta-12 desaturase)
MELSDAERAAMAAQYGYTQIGKEVPSDVTLTDIVKSMPQE